MSSRPVYRMCAQVAPSGECLRGKGPPDRMLAKLGAVCFWQPISSGPNLVVAAVVRDSLCVVSLLPCVADCCMLYTVCKVGRFVLTIIKRRLFYINFQFFFFLCRQTDARTDAAIISTRWLCSMQFGWSSHLTLQRLTVMPLCTLRSRSLAFLYNVCLCHWALFARLHVYDVSVCCLYNALTVVCICKKNKCWCVCMCVCELWTQPYNLSFVSTLQVESGRTQYM